MVTEAEARARLERLVAASSSPTLTAEEVDALLELSQLVDSTGRAASDDTEWEASTDYAIGDVVVPTSRTGDQYVATVAGTSDASEPAWDTEAPVTDGGVTWELSTSLPAAWQPSYDLSIAAIEGWTYKAGTVADRFRFSQEGESYDRQQIFDHCTAMSAYFEKQRGKLTVGDQTGTGGAFELELPRSSTVLGLDRERLIQLRRWDGAGEIPAVNGPWRDS